MNRLKLGIRLESTHVPLRQALLEAQRIGVAGVQVDALGDLAPDRLSQTGRREILHLLRAHDLELTAMGCPLRRGLAVQDNQEARIDLVKKVLSLSFDLGARVVVVPVGKVPEKPDGPSRHWLAEALGALARHGDRVGAVLALQTGQEAGEVLARFLESFDSGGLGVNVDPAQFLMGGFDPIASTRALGGKIVHAHARDARRAAASPSVQEVPLGHGDLDWMELLGLLEELDYRGWLTLTRETSPNPIADLAQGAAFLRRLGV